MTPGLISKMTSPAGINYLNIGLMLISVIASYILPFEVFLFSYAFLGPLHYLTEISWLEKKNYFIRSRTDIWIFVALVCIITIGMFNQHSKINAFMGSLLFSGFIYALIILFVDKIGIKIFLIAATFVVSVMLNLNHYPDTGFLLFGIWLPTIIHVFIFTGAFILYGALRSRSVSGILSLVVFVCCAVLFFVYTPESYVAVSDYGKNAYSYFRLLNTSLHELFGYGSLALDDTLYKSVPAVAIMRFIAFAYTYHYLNWFSKTTVIKWNEVSRKRMGMIILLWILSVVLYVFSYEIGFYALFLLSMLHVFFEFPLNHQTFIGIGKEFRSLIRK
ncbi:MAG: hypothetical protein M3R27_05020 [Bacteroidota bacterium]|nr:hypothetical protein [Bacteroidota bacterium]